MRFTGGVFDGDGVLLDTPHAPAWREALAQLMAGPRHALAPGTSYRAGALSDAVYHDYVAGKPRKARALGMAPGQCFVVEDAAVGIQAAKSGGMYGIGVARHQDGDDLRAAGADIVVERLDTVDVQALVGDVSAGLSPTQETPATDRHMGHP